MSSDEMMACFGFLLGACNSARRRLERMGVAPEVQKILGDAAAKLDHPALKGWHAALGAQGQDVDELMAGHETHTRKSRSKGHPKPRSHHLDDPGASIAEDEPTSDKK